ncbi:hypothetical protein [Pseudomonas citronellolis]|uniref:hypothetical protein n=1 Tax=Pseudomonas citronellolis TaxID=53408 RepID=UPI003AADD972
MANVSQLKNDLNALQTTERIRKALNPLEQPGARPATKGLAPYTPPATPGTGGIASPLVEKTKLESGKQVPDRDYYPDGLTSSDGLLILPAIKTMRMTDANGAAVEFQLANPKGTV